MKSAQNKNYTSHQHNVSAHRYSTQKNLSKQRLALYTTHNFTVCRQLQLFWQFRKKTKKCSMFKKSYSRVRVSRSRRTFARGSRTSGIRLLWGGCAHSCGLDETVARYRRGPTVWPDSTFAPTGRPTARATSDASRNT